MYELEKSGKLFTSKSVRTGPTSYVKRIYLAAVSQKFSKQFSWINVLWWKYSEEKNVRECVEKIRPQILAWGNYNMLQDFISPVIDN